MSKTLSQNQNVMQLLNGQFFVNPKEIFCGDKVLLQYQVLIPDEYVLALGNYLPLKITNPEEFSNIIKTDSLTCTVESFSLELSGNLLIYQINCVAWQLGKISFPNIIIELDSISLELPVSEFTVSSILEKTGESSIQPVLAPILLPGTTYIVYGSIFLGIIFLSLIIFAFTKSSKIYRFFKNIIINYKYKKNHKKCLALLKKLNKNSENLSNVDFAEQLQIIMRGYFSYRFSDKVYNLATSEIVSWFSSIYNLILPEQAEEAIHLFYELMHRCDFLRFSGNSVKGAELQESERDDLIQKGISIMNLIEKGSVNV